jgi:hypothetical protein
MFDGVCLTGILGQRKIFLLNYPARGARSAR